MKYRLKDQALQKRLDEVTGGNFSNRLQDNDFVKRMEIKGHNVAVSLLLLTEEIEPIPEYTTKGWNPFPEVTPPTEVDMRVEIKDGRGYMAWWDGHDWRIGNHSYSDDDYLNAVKRFRPWEDEE